MDSIERLLGVVMIKYSTASLFVYVALGASMACGQNVVEATVDFQAALRIHNETGNAIEFLELPYASVPAQTKFEFGSPPGPFQSLGTISLDTLVIPHSSATMTVTKTLGGDVYSYDVIVEVEEQTLSLPPFAFSGTFRHDYLLRGTIGTKESQVPFELTSDTGFPVILLGESFQPPYEIIVLPDQASQTVMFDSGIQELGVVTHLVESIGLVCHSCDVVVPEPDSLANLLIALAAISWFRKRSDRKRCAYSSSW